MSRMRLINGRSINRKIPIYPPVVIGSYLLPGEAERSDRPPEPRIPVEVVRKPVTMAGYKPAAVVAEAQVAAAHRFAGAVAGLAVVPVPTSAYHMRYRILCHPGHLSRSLYKSHDFSFL